MHADLIQTLAGGLTAALVLGYITQRIGLSPIVGYLLAGYVIGPNSPGFVADIGVAEQFAEVGVILLMFGVGLQFHVEELLRVRRVALPGALGQSLVATLLGCAVALWAGWGWSAGLVFGIAISVASTVVLLRVLTDTNELHTRAGHVAIGWLVVEDLFTVLVLVLMPVIFAEQAVGWSGLAWSLIWSVIKLSCLIAFTLIIAQKWIPKLLEHIAATRSRELFTLSVLVLALGIAVCSAKLFGASMALGAFLAGLVVGRSDFSLRAATEALPMRDAFAVLFFVSVGMLFDPMALVEEPLLILATLAIVVIGKPLTAMGIVLFLNYPLRTALSVGIALAQIGEFSFILASLGEKLHVLNDQATQAIVAAAMISISLCPAMYRLIVPLETALRKSPLARRWLSPHLLGEVSGTLPTNASENDGNEATAVVIGYGPVGRTVVDLLRQNEIVPTVVELNLDTVHRLQAKGIRAIYGDASLRDTLVAAGVPKCVAVIISAAGMQHALEIIRLARLMNPDARVFVRANYLVEAGPLREAGANLVFTAEGEVSLGMTEFLLRQLGATAEQIDRERDRIRRELFGGAVKLVPMMSNGGNAQAAPVAVVEGSEPSSA